MSTSFTKLARRVATEYISKVNVMSDLKKQLIKLGSTNPELRPHIREILAYTKEDLKEIETALKSVGLAIGKRVTMKALMDASTPSLSRAESVLDKYLNTYPNTREKYKGVDLESFLENTRESLSEEILDRQGKAHSIRTLIRTLAKEGVKVTRTLENSFHDKSDALKALGGISPKGLESIFSAAAKTVKYYQGPGRSSGSDMYLRTAIAYMNASEALKPAPEVSIDDIDLEDLWKAHTRMPLYSAERMGNALEFVGRTGHNYADSESERDMQRGLKAVMAVGNAIVKSSPVFKGSKVTADWVDDDYFSVTIRLP